MKTNYTMTLGEFFAWAGQNPVVLLLYFLAIPAIALLAGVFSKGEGHLSPWKYLYSTLIYMVAIPGIFAITLCIYLFLFERQPIMETNLHTQVLPVLSMIVTLLVIKKQVKLEQIPGFDRLSGLIMIIGCLIVMMWIIDKTHIYAITFMPFYVVVLILLAGFFVIRMGMRRMGR